MTYRTIRFLLALACTLGGVFLPQYARAQTETQTPPESGPSFKVGAGLVAGMFGLTYKGPPVSMSDFDGPSPTNEISRSGIYSFLAAELTAGVNFGGSGPHRFGFAASALAGATFKAWKPLPYTDDPFLGVISLGPTYSYRPSAQWEVNGSLRGAVLGLAAGGVDIGAYDNVIDFPPHWGGLGRLGFAYRPRPHSTFALTSHLTGGPQFAEYQTTYVVGWGLGVQWN